MDLIEPGSWGYHGLYPSSPPYFPVKLPYYYYLSAGCDAVLMLLLWDGCWMPADCGLTPLAPRPACGGGGGPSSSVR